MPEEVFDRVKAATVALVVLSEKVEDEKKMPYTVIGSGFCVHPRGVIVTCRHVLDGFMTTPLSQKLADIDEEHGKDNQHIEIETLTPQALFFLPHESGDQLVIIPTGAEQAMAKTDFDLGMFRVSPHAAFPNGYPTVEIEDYDQVKEGMETAVCGFPLGEHLYDQIGTITSSFTRGIVSSIIPSPGVPKEHLKGFQLNITATHGNSGGPVFSLGSGKVFGVLQRGIEDGDGGLLEGLVKAEPIYPLLEHDSLERMIESPAEQLPPQEG